MSLKQLTASFPWTRYSKKLAARIEKPRNSGYFDPEESAKRGMRLVKGAVGEHDEGNVLAFFWLVDKENGAIVDAKFQAMGQTALIGAADAACDLLVGKNYDQARRIGADLIDRQLRDASSEPAFPPETAPHLNLVLEAVDEAASLCTDIPLPSSYQAPPAPRMDQEEEGKEYPGFLLLAKEQQMAVIEEVLNREVRPYIALDGGGIELLDLRQEREVVIAYQGNCTSCYSSVGATLSYIQQTIKNHIHPELIVIPELENLS